MEEETRDANGAMFGERQDGRGKRGEAEDEISGQFRGGKHHPHRHHGHGHVPRYRRDRHEPEGEDYYYYGPTHRRIRWWWDLLWFRARSFALVTFTLHALFSSALSVGATLVCIHIGFRSDMPIALFSSALAFPLSFGISFHLQRRDALLRLVGVFRASVLSMWWGARDWLNLGDEHEDAMRELKRLFTNLLDAVRKTMTHENPPGGSHDVYRAFDALALFMRDVADRDKDFGGSGMHARWGTFFQHVLETFESMRVNHDYRTPSSYRAYTLFYLSFFPLLFSPLFSNYEHLYGLASALYPAVLSSVMFSALYRIFSNEEDPMDGRGQDDLSLESLTSLPELMYPRPKGEEKEIPPLNDEAKVPLEADSVRSGP